MVHCVETQLKLQSHLLSVHFNASVVVAPNMLTSNYAIFCQVNQVHLTLDL